MRVLKVRFIYPSEPAESQLAGVDDRLTAGQLLASLSTGGRSGPLFVPERPLTHYYLFASRTHTVIPPERSFAEAGVQDQDVIEVREVDRWL